jgi:hypothetical protein
MIRISCFLSSEPLKQGCSSGGTPIGFAQFSEISVRAFLLLKRKRRAAKQTSAEMF